MKTYHKLFFLLLFIVVGFSAKAGFSLAASKCWIGGGSGTNWSSTGPTNWGDCAGGTDQAVPGSSDDVFFNASSGVASSTISASISIKSLDMTNSTDIITQAAATNLTIAGSGVTFKLAAGKYTTTNVTTSDIIFTGTSGTTTITTAGVSLGDININGAGGVFALADNLTIGGTSTLTLTTGTLHTDGAADNSALTHSWGTFTSNGASTRVLFLGASNITVTAGGSAWGIGNTVIGGVTVFSGTSSITMTGAAVVFGGAYHAAGGTTDVWYDLTITGSGLATVNSSNIYSFHNFTRTATNVKTDSVAFGVSGNGMNITITGTLTLAGGNSDVNRLLVRSNLLGTVTTITLSGGSATTTISRADFRDIAFATASGGPTMPVDLSAITGNSGDCGGNSNITFTPAATQTATGTASFTWSTHGWTTRVPLPQDDVVINNAFVSGRTVTLDMPRAGKSIDWSGATWSGTAPNWLGSVNTTNYGSVTLVSGMTVTSSVFLTMEGRGAFTFTSAGVTWGNSTIIAMLGGTVTLQDAYNSTGSLTLSNGTFNAATFNVTCLTFTSNSSVARTLSMGSGTWTVTSTVTVWNLATGGLTFTPNTSTINVSNTSSTGKTFAGGGATAYNNVIFSGDNITVTGNNTFNGIFAVNNRANNSNGGLKLTAASVQTIAKFDSNGVSGTLSKLGSTGAAATLTLSDPAGIVSTDYISLSSSTVTSGLFWYAGANSTNVVANTGWTFATSTVRYWVGGTATWDATAGSKWAIRADGPGGYAVPGSTDSVYLTASTSAVTITLSSTTIRGLNASSTTISTSPPFNGTLSHPAGVTLTIGDGTVPASSNALIFPSSGMTYTLGDPATSAISFTSTTSTVENVSFGGMTGGNITFDGVGGSWKLTGNLTNGSTASLTLTNGTLNTNGQTVSVGALSSSNSNTRTLTLGGSSFTVKGTGTVWDFGTTTGLTFTAATSTVLITDTSGTGKTFTTGGLNFNNFTVSGSNITFGGTVALGSTGGTWNNTGGGTVIFSGSVTNNGTFNGGAGTYNFTATGTPFTNNGIFTASTSLVSFQGTSGTTTVPNLPFYNLEFSPSSGLPVFLYSGWYDTSWQYRKPIVIDHNKVASSTSETYANFPVLISLGSDSDLAARASSTGADILFTSVDGTTKLNHEIEKYTSASGALLAWVKMSGISTSTDTTIYMYYGNSVAADQQAVTSTWNSSYYKAVYHLKEDPSGVAPQLRDSTLTGANLTTQGSMTSGQKIGGQIGDSISLDGTNDLASTTPSAISAYPFTISAWIAPTGNNTTYREAAGMSGAATTYFGIGNNTTATGHHIDLVARNTTFRETACTASTATSTWVYVVGVFRGAQDRELYANGASCATDVTNSVAFSATRMGLTTNGTFAFDNVDEARFASGTPTTDWILTEYNNQSATSTFYSVGSQASALAVTNNLTTAGAGSPTVDLYTNNIPLTVSGNVTIGSGGTLLAPSSSAFTLLGSLTNNGTFTHNNGTVTASSTTTSTIGGSSVTTFYNFTSTIAGKTIQFKAGQQTAFSHTLTLTGTDANPIHIQSDTSGSQWFMNLTGTYSITYIFVKDSGCFAGTLTIAANGNITNGGNNGSCWSMSIFAGSGGSSGGGGTQQGGDGVGGGGSQQSGGGSGGGSSGGGTGEGGDGGSGGGDQQSGGGSGGGGGGAP